MTSSNNTHGYHVPKSVVIVDADPTALAESALALSQSRYDVRTSSSFYGSLELLQETPADLLIADVRLGAFNGLHIVARCRAERREIAAIVTHISRDAVLEQDALRLGAAYLVKPIEPGHLRRIADDVLAGRGPKPWTGFRQWPRKHLGGSPDAEVLERRARLHDVSYGGIHFEIQGLAHDLPPAFEVTILDWGLSLTVRAVWQKRDAAGSVWCGAALSQALAHQQLTWRTLVDRAEASPC